MSRINSYKVYVQLREGYKQDVIIQSDSALSATYQARAQYGEENVFGMASLIIDENHKYENY
jgi:fatty acid-binding protein DegV